MAIELHGECAMVIKREIGLRFSGGMEAFRQRYGSRNLQDGYLIALCADCSSGLQTIVDELTENGLVVGEHFALAGVWDGVYTACEGINFHRKPCHDGNVRWAAVSSDDPRPGKVTVCKPHPGETCFGGGSGILIPFRPPPAPPTDEADDGMLPMALKHEEQLLQMVTQDMKRLGITPSDEPSEGQDKPPGQPVEGTDPMLPAMDGLEDAIQSLVIQSMERRGIKPSTPPGSENDNPMLGAMNALEEALEEAYRQNMARLGLEPYDEPPEGTEKGSHE